MPLNPVQKLEDILLAKGLINSEKYQTVVAEHHKHGTPVKEIVINEGLVSEEDVTKIHAEISGYQYIDPTEGPIQPEAVTLVPEQIARKYNIMPLKVDGTKIKIAMTDPDDLELIQFLERSTQHNIDIYVSTAESISRAIDKEYTKSLGQDVSHAIEQAAATTTQKMKETLKSIDQADEIIKVSPVAQIVSVILEYAVKSGASDIHIEPYENKTRIRYRIDGILAEKFPLPITIHNSIVARIKILANMPIDEKRKPLDGKFKVEFGDRKTDLRVSTIPTVNGEKVVIRLLKADQETLTLDKLGLWGQAHDDFEKTLKQSTGILLVTGPTGSGKTVTLATSLEQLNSVKVNIITLEDPVEISIPGVNQVQINQQAGLTFASGLRSILRQDPNIIMVGEIRDIETAKLAIQAALTGHLVLATLHTNSAAASITRLVDMGVEPFLIASTVNLCLAQRLVRRLCNHCKQKVPADPKFTEDIKKVLGERLLKLGLGESKLHEDIKKGAPSEPITPVDTQTYPEDQIFLYKAKGCEKCNDTGYKGRIGLFEVIRMNSAMRVATEANSPVDKLTEQAINSGMITLLQDGYIKSLWGITTLEEVLTVTD